MAEIWTADWIFTNNIGIEFVSKDVVTKRIPVQFLLNEGLSYPRALKGLLLHSSSVKKFISELKHDQKTGLKKFRIKYNKKIGETNNIKKHDSY